MMKNLLKTYTFLLIVCSFSFLLSAQKKAITVTFINIPKTIEEGGKVAPGDELRFIINNIPNGNQDLNANFRYYNNTNARHAQVVLDITADGNDQKNFIVKDGEDVYNKNGTFNRTFVANRIPPRLATAPEYKVGEVLKARVRIVGPDGHKDIDPKPGVNPKKGNLTTKVVH